MRLFKSPDLLCDNFIITEKNYIRRVILFSFYVTLNAEKLFKLREQNYAIGTLLEQTKIQHHLYGTLKWFEYIKINYLVYRAYEGRTEEVCVKMRAPAD